jgi:L-arabinose transport system permease protein
VRPALRSLGMVPVLLLLCVLCAVLVPGFASAPNVPALLLQVSTVGLVACTMLFCLASGNFDLSVGSVVACAGVLTAVVMRGTGSITLGVLAGLGAGAMTGLVNGVVVARLGINPLIATLATMQVVRGLGFIACDGRTVGVTQTAFSSLGNAQPLGLPLPAWLCLSSFAVFGFVLERTTFGRATLAIGGNEEAARLAGIPVVAVKVWVFVLQGIMAAFAGVVLAARLDSGQPNLLQGFELAVISACVLGGVSLSGGVGSMLSVVTGVLIMGVVENAMSLANVPSFWQYVVRGVILLVAVVVDRWQQHQR